ncbi:hypothetical protein PYW07_010591 [Mythimna separata]|uniref:Clip domain-containing protein n=1 Tax=Mythimna separata TaxID=271217 RepID=A0AAD8DMI4_MYTSE|nr:hypothetical protein PYW07_010591 [Mythimna separata]
MLKVLPIFLLIAVVYCQKDLDALIDNIFGPERSNATENTPQAPPVSSGIEAKPQPAIVSTDEETREPCTLDNGEKGVCITYYKCKTKLEPVPEGYIDIRPGVDQECPLYIQTCCLASDIE